ncbi:hypothetical protein AAFF_G00344330 [Aldrovandia affinis]|uniref:Uncharacterized protein n=1 Tax=Aldrovandia affinis TaxID=143900 RepID=A0AAD7WPD1_9TELE|nr:hypothetical protein AAFF_G00344330 [Aldrovandia affinis]
MQSMEQSPIRSSCSCAPFPAETGSLEEKATCQMCSSLAANRGHIASMSEVPRSQRSLDQTLTTRSTLHRLTASLPQPTPSRTRRPNEETKFEQL